MEDSLINKDEIKTTNCSNRSLGLDILRILAFMCVIGVHMFSLNHYYQLNPNSVPMYFLTFIRNFLWYAFHCF